MTESDKKIVSINSPNPVPVVEDVSELGLERLWSSEQSRPWTDFKVELFQHNLRQIESFITAFCHVNFYIGDNSRIDYRGSGGSFTRTQHYGTIEILPTGSLYSSEPDGARNSDIFMQLEPDLIERTALACDLAPDRIELVSAFPEEDLKIQAVALAFKAEMESETPAPKIFGESLAQALAAHLLQNYSNTKPLVKNYRNGLPPRVLQRVLEYIEANLENSLSLEELAAVSGYSSFYFVRMFKTAMNKTPHEYIVERRVEKAKTLIKSNDLSLVEIALETGFSSEAHFSTVFKKQTGKTPKDFLHKK